jgi:hypothetical protein
VLPRNRVKDVLAIDAEAWRCSVASQGLGTARPALGGPRRTTRTGQHKLQLAAVDAQPALAVVLRHPLVALFDVGHVF